MAFIKGEKKDHDQGIILSVNISAQKGMSKTPVKSAVLVKEYGLEGDAHAGGDAARQVSLLSLESIRKITVCPKLRKSGIEIKPGDFAENITFSNICFSKLRIGRRLKLGTDALLEVTRIGKECHVTCEIFKKLKTCIMPKEGIFCRVLKGGKIKPGDILEVDHD